jgi:hypothetical protein
MNRKDTIRVYAALRDRYDGARNIRNEGGSITLTTDQMPNTSQAGRIFVGYDTDLLRQLDNDGQLY